MRVYLLLGILSFFLLSCGEDVVQAPDVSAIEGKFNLFRMEQEIMTADTNDLETSFLKHPAFMEIYLNGIMGFRENQTKNIKGFISDENINLLYQATQIQYGDFDELTSEFERAFQFYKYYFPERQIPDVYTFISEYGIQRFIFSDEDEKDALGIGLDMFLGADYPYAQFIPNNEAFSQYLIRRFNKEHLVKRCMGALVEDIIGENPGRNLLEKMVHNGKKLYILDKILPYEADSIIMEYTGPQMDWVEDNQVEMWAYLLKEDLFYESDINKINKLVNPSPNSPGMPEAAPGRTANFLGWKIVEAYMNRQQNYFIQDLVLEKDAQKILNISKFKPRK